MIINKKILYIFWIVIIAGIFTSSISGIVQDFLSDSINIAIFLFLIILLALFSFSRIKTLNKQEIEREYRLIKKTKDLKPKDLGFIEMEPGEILKSTERPYFKTYIQREAIPYETNSAPSRTYNEQDLSHMLEKGDNILLVGNPTEGKTRTLFEVMRQLQDFTVICLHTNITPSVEAVKLLKGKNVLWLLDDLNSFNNTSHDSQDLLNKFKQISNYCVLAATCRDGNELKNLLQETGPLQKIYETFDYQLKLKPPQAWQKEKLKTAIGESETREFPTLGSICMRKHFKFMRDRFVPMKDLEKDCLRSILLLYAAAITPLSWQRIKAVLEDIFDREVNMAETRDCLNTLSSNGFIISPKDTDPIIPEAAYITEPESEYYSLNGHSPQGDMRRLAESLIKHKDADGLNSMALSHYDPNDTKFSLTLLEQLVNNFKNTKESGLQEQVAKALFYKGIILGQLEISDEAIKCYDEILQRFGNSKELVLQEQVAKALVNKGGTLEQPLNEFEEAIACCDEVLKRFGDKEELVLQEPIARALLIKGTILGQLEKSDEAIKCYDDIDEAIKCYNEILQRFWNSKRLVLLELIAKTLIFKGLTLNRRLNKYYEGITCYSKVVQRFGNSKELTLQKMVSTAFLNMSRALRKLEKSNEAIKCYDYFNGAIKCYDGIIQRFRNSEDLVLQEQVAEALFGKAYALGQLENSGEVIICYDDIDEAILCYDEVVQRFENSKELPLQAWVAKSLSNKGSTLGQLLNNYNEEIKCHDEVIQRFENSKELALQEIVANALFNKSIALENLEKSEEAIKCLNNLIKRIERTQEPSLQELINEALVLKGNIINKRS